MLVRAYRITDKFGLLVLKISAALSDAVVENAGFVRRGVLGRVWAVIRRIALAVWSVLRVVFAAVGAVVLWILGLFGFAGRYAGQSAGSVMARRAARAELEANLAEDPLRAQNRVLSGVIVVLLAALIVIVLWATNPTPQNTFAVNPSVGLNAANNLALAASTEDVTPQSVAAALPTAVPTATPIPEILEARGSLAYVVRERGQDDVWLVGVGERTPLRLTNSPEDERDPAWSPDGRRLAYASRQDGNWEIYIRDMQSGETTRMTYDLSFQGGPRWSPDSQWLVYESYQGGNLDIYIMKLEGADAGQTLRLTAHPEPDFSPAWSPDGRRIAFVSWRDGSQDIYVVSLDDPRDEAAINITNSPGRNEDHPAWSPDGDLLAYSAVDEGVEKVFVKSISDPDAPAQVLGRGSSPTWSPDGASLIVMVESFDGTQMIAVPFAQQGVATLVVNVSQGSSSPDWTSAPLPPALVNSGGLEPAITEPLFVEQAERANSDPPYKLQSISVDTPIAALSDRVNDSFNALRARVNTAAGLDFLGELEDAFWSIERLPQPGEERRNWHMTGRGFAINRNNIAGFPPPIELVREDTELNTFWRVFVRVADDAQDGQLGEPLRHLPWDFISRNQGDVDAYNQGGRVRPSVPQGYYVDLTRLAEDYGWERLPAGTDWRANFNSINYWMFYKPEGLAWYDAMREIYTEGELGGFAPRATTIPAQPPTDDAGDAESEPVATTAPTQPTLIPEQATVAPLLPPPPTVQLEEEEGG